jgi:hypothetical protein
VKPFVWKSRSWAYAGSNCKAVFAMNHVAPSSTIDGAGLRAFAANAGWVDCEVALIIENAIPAVALAASLASNHVKANAIERHIRGVRSGRVQARRADASFVATRRGGLR